MALKGTLKDFGISEILQMIGTQKKTGLLVVEDLKRRAQVEFSEGTVVAADGGEITPSFGERLFKGGFISKEQLASLEKQARDTLKPLPYLAISSNILGQDVVKRLYIRQTSEIVYEIFSWKDGTYEFNQKFVQWDTQYVTPIPAEGIMMEGLRITDEGPSVKKTIPSLDDVLARGEGIAVELDKMDANTKALFKNIDGVKTVKEVILASDQDRFDGLKNLAWLKTNHYIVIRKAGSSRVKTPAPALPQKLNALTLVALLTLLAICFGGLVFKVGGALWAFAAPLAHGEGESTPLTTILGDARLDKVRNALETYYLENGKYPDNLKLLVEAKLVDSGDIKPLGHKMFAYEQRDSGKSYSLGDESAIASRTPAPVQPADDPAGTTPK